MQTRIVTTSLAFFAALLVVLASVAPVMAVSSTVYPAYNSIDAFPSSSGCTQIFYGSGAYTDQCQSGSTSTGQANVEAVDYQSGNSVYAHIYFDHSTYATGGPTIQETSAIYCCVRPSLGMSFDGSISYSGSADAALDAVYYVYYCSTIGCTPTVTGYVGVIYDAFSQGNAYYSCSSCAYVIALYSDPAGYYTSVGGTQVGASDVNSGSGVSWFYPTGLYSYYATVNDLSISG